MSDTIKDFKEKYPYYKNVPDLELAEKLYEKYYRGRDVDETEYYKRLFPNIAAERAEDTLDITELDIAYGMQFDPSTLVFKPTTEEIAKQAGVSVNDPAETSARFAGSFGYNKEEMIIGIKKSLSKIYNQDIDVRIGPNTGKLEYFNPKINDYALVDKPGMDIGDFGDIGSHAFVIGADIAGTIAGTIFTTPVGGIATGAISAGAAEYFRLKYGQKHYGVNLNLTDDQLLNEAFKTAGISVGAGFLGLGAVKLIKSINNVVQGRSFSSVDEGAKSLQSARALESETVAKEINKTLEDASIKSRLKYTLAEATDDKDLLALQSAFENKRVLGKLGQFREFGEVQAGSLNSYFKLMKERFGVYAGSTYDTGKLINEVVEKRSKNSIKNIIKKQETSENLLTKTLFRLPDGSTKVTGIEFRSIIGDLSKTYKADVKLAAKELDNVTGIKTIKTDEIAKAIAKLSNKETKNLINVAKVEGVFKKDIFDSLANPNGTIPLANARETISTLGKLIREKEIGLAAGESVDVGRLKFLKEVFTKQVKKNAGAEYLDELQKFNDLVITNKELLNNSIISKLTKIDVGSVLKIADEDIFETTFKQGLGNGKAAKEVYDVVSKSPEALNAYKNSIFDFYKTKVLVDGKPDLIKHNAFIKAYEKPLRIFFNEAEYNKISRIGGLKKILIKNPEVYKKFQRDVLRDLNEKVFKLDKKFTLGRVLDAKAFDRYLNGGGGEAGYRTVLREIFGNEYVKNLDILNKALQIADRSATTAQQGVVASAFTDIIRARVGQFTFAGRLLTAFRRIFTGASNRLLARALLNPDSLKDLVALRKLSKFSKGTAIILAKLGASNFLVQDDGAPVPPKEAVIKQDAEVASVNRSTTEGEGDIVQMASLPKRVTPQLNTPGISEALLTTASTRPTGINATGLTPTELGLLSPEEQAIRLRQRGMA